MMKKFPVILIAFITLAFLISGCAPRTAETVVEKIEAPAMAAAVSDGSEDLKIDFQTNLAMDDPDSHFTFSGNIRYMAADMDKHDAVTGASALGSTHLFQAYLYDVEGKATMSGGLRGLFLFGVTPHTQVTGDNLNASKSSDGVITIQYAHRGSAYRIVTGKNGELSLPGGTFLRRNIGYIVGGGPQVISMDFSADGTAATIDWDKVWDPKVADGKMIGDTDKKTGPIINYGASSDAMYVFDGTLDVSLDADILKISGSLTAVKQ